ncbi:recombinase family protein [Herbidospora daliensis]|uniref:recombinase family protein n=1 Tax=Herbidospora daliensis TaxID=295585 RepID=UPI000A6D3351|nr:recombinase family protein [Herbidospora daliensis]
MTAVEPRRRRGRPPCCPPDVALRVLALRDQGLSLAAISRVLNEEGVRTPAGGRFWQKSHVDRLLHTLHARELREDPS